MNKQEAITLIWFIIGLFIVIYSTSTENNQGKESFSEILSKSQLNELNKKTINFYNQEYSSMIKQTLTQPQMLVPERGLMYHDLGKKFSFEPRRADANLEPFSLPPKKSYSIDNFTFTL